MLHYEVRRQHTQCFTTRFEHPQENRIPEEIQKMGSRGIQKNGLLQKMAFCLIFVGFGLRVSTLLFHHFVGSVWFWYGFTVFQNAHAIPTNPNIFPPFCWVRVTGLSCLNLPQLFFHFLDPRGGSPRRKMAFSRELGNHMLALEDPSHAPPAYAWMAGLKSHMLN